MKALISLNKPLHYHNGISLSMGVTYEATWSEDFSRWNVTLPNGNIVAVIPKFVKEFVSENNLIAA
jgi:hypothetical protein